MGYTFIVKEKAIKLRNKGYSLGEISHKCHISQSTASLWMRSVRLGIKAEMRLQNHKLLGRKHAIKTIRNNRLGREKERLDWAINYWKNKNLTREEWQLIVALLYWGEGGKFTNRVDFTNSDVMMVNTFINGLILGFEIDKSRIKVNLHLHSYHNEKQQKNYWSTATGLEINQFSKSYIKPNSGKIKRINYPGCIRICYHSKDLVERLKALYTMLANLRP